MTTGIIENQYIRAFLLGGNCECIIENVESGNRYLYKIQVAKDNPNMFFIKSLTGMGDIYAGFLTVKDGEYIYAQGKKGQITDEDKRIKALLYVLSHAETLRPTILVQHVGRCSKCNRKLTNPESMNRGMGPECFSKAF